MKKFLSVISLLLVAAMLMATPMYISATESEAVSYGKSADYILSALADSDPTNDSIVYRVPGNNVNASLDNVDGIISVNDPWYGQNNVGNQTAMWLDVSGSSVGTTQKNDYSEGLNTINDISYYFAQDEDYIYISFIDELTGFYYNGSDKLHIPRHNYYFRLGFDPDDFTKFVQFFANSDSGADNVSKITLFDNEGNFAATGSEKPRGTDVSATYQNGTSNLIAKMVTKKYKTVEGLKVHDSGYTYPGTECSSDSNVGSPWILYREMAIDKDVLLTMLNDLYGKNYTSVPDAFFFSHGSRVQVMKNDVWQGSAGGNMLWDVTPIDGNPVTDLTTKITPFYMPALVVLDKSMQSTYTTPTIIDADYVPDAGQNVHLVGSSAGKTITVDGKVSAGEYAYTSSKLAISNYYNGENYTDLSNKKAWVTNADSAESKILDNSRMQLSFAEDDENIYIGIVESGAISGSTVPCRFKYAMRIGYDPTDFTKHISIQWNGNSHDATLGYADMIGNAEYAGTNIKVGTTQSLGEQTVYADGDVITACTLNYFRVGETTPVGGSGWGSANYSAGERDTHIELVVSKAGLRKLLYGENDDTSALPNAFWFDLMAGAYLNAGGSMSVNNGAVVSWTGGSYLKQAALVAGIPVANGWTHIPDFVVLGAKDANGVACNNQSHSADNSGVYTVRPSTCTINGLTYTYCSECGTQGATTLNLIDHVYDQSVVDAKYLATEKDCDSYAVYYMSCVCGAYAETADTFEDEDDGYRPHIPVLNRTDATEHWYDCQHEDCNAILDAEGNVAAKVRHTYDQTDDITYPVGVRLCLSGADYYKTCVCGRASIDDVDYGTDGYEAATFKQGDAPGHIWSEWVSNDPTHHWKTCTSETCEDTYHGKFVEPTFTAAQGGPGFYGAHNYVATDDLTKTEKAADATCTVPDLYYKVCECGKISATETFEVGDALGHDYETTLTSDETNHWYACSRGENCSDQADAKNATASAYAAHAWDQQVIDEKYVKFEGDCKLAKVYYKSCVCGAFSDAEDAATFETEIVLTNHVWGDTPVSQNNYHFYQCVKCSATDDVVACTFANGSTKCAVCGGAAVTVAPVPSNPGTVVPEETTPVETQPAETQPAETQPAETQPAETQPAETTPAETTPAETEPAVTEPAETEPVATEPAETEPADEAGCAGAISIMGLALVATLGACGVVATKKKDEE